MTRTVYLTATTLDGFIATEDNDLDWLLQFEGEDPTVPYPAFIENVGALAMGSTTYRWLLDHDPGAWPYADRRTWVFTHRDLPRRDDAAVTFTDADVAAVHEQMVRAADGRDVWLVGGGDLVGQFLDRGLLDEIWVSIAPVTLGRGAPLLPRRHTTPMRVVEVLHTSGAPLVHVHYSLR